MTTMMQHMQRFMRDEEGAVAIEYGLLAVLIALGIVVGATTLGEGLGELFENIANCFPNPSANCASGAPPAP